MRNDLEFLYQKAMRSKDYEFMDEIYCLLVDAGFEKMADDVSIRIHKFLCNGFNAWPMFSKFDFLIEDSFGDSWYKTK